MKRRRSEFLASVGSMLLLADILHSVLQQRGGVKPRCHTDDSEKCAKQMDKAFKRFCTAVDYTAQKAHTLLKKKMTPADGMQKSTVLFTLLPVSDVNEK